MPHGLQNLVFSAYYREFFLFGDPHPTQKIRTPPREIKKDYVCFCLEYADTYGMKPVLILSKTLIKMFAERAHEYMHPYGTLAPT